MGFLRRLLLLRGTRLRLNVTHVGINSLRLGGGRSLLSLGSSLLLLLKTLINIAHDVVEHKVPRRLLCEDEGLDELLGLEVIVGQLANDLDDDVVSRLLRIDVGDTNLALLEALTLNPFLD